LTAALYNQRAFRLVGAVISSVKLLITHLQMSKVPTWQIGAPDMLVDTTRQTGGSQIIDLRPSLTRVTFLTGQRKVKKGGNVYSILVHTFKKTSFAI
jgi:hypothetical protein